MWKGVIEEYRRFLPVVDETPVISLSEGNTPLIKARKLLYKHGIALYFKFEGANPTGSFKDRGMTLAVSKAVEAGDKAIICASTGNTAASAAAYAARAGMKCYILLPQGKVAKGKLAQALAYGAKVIELTGNFDQALYMVQQLADKLPLTIVNSLNPFRIECQKTGAFEVCDALQHAPDYLFIPVGNAGNITAYWQGFQEYYNGACINKLPAMMGWQAAGSAPIVKGQAVKRPETIATAIRIGNPVSWQKALQAVQASQGAVDMVTDEEITEAYLHLAQQEGIHAEPASCAAVAGAIKAVNKGQIPKGSCIVVVLTGHGLKDPEFAVDKGSTPITAPVCFTEVANLIEEELHV